MRRALSQKAAELFGHKIDELSVIYKTGPDGKPWAPRNPESMILGLKGGPTDADGKPKSWLAKVGEFVAKGFVVTEDEASDDTSRHEMLLGLLAATNYDLSSAYALKGSARTDAVCTLLDNFDDNYADIVAHKGGARHSKADKEKLDSMKGHADKISGHADAISAESDKGDNANVSEMGTKADAIGNHADKIKKLHADLTGEEKNESAADKESEAGDKDGEGEDDTEKARAFVARIKAGSVGTDGLAENFVLEYATGGSTIFSRDEYAAFLVKAKKDDNEGDYGDVEYADPGYQSDKKKRYPVNDKAHAKNAWSRINDPDNAGKYSSDDLAKVKAKIKSACKKFGVEISDGKGGPTDLTIGFDASGADTVLAKIEQMLKGVETGVTEQLTVFETKIDGKLAEVTQKAGAASDGTSKLAETVAAIKAAREERSPGALPVLASDGITFKSGVAAVEEQPVKITRDMPATGKDGAIQTLLRNGRIATS